MKECRVCGKPVKWQERVGVIRADGSSVKACVSCADKIVADGGVLRKDVAAPAPVKGQDSRISVLEAQVRELTEVIRKGGVGVAPAAVPAKAVKPAKKRG